MRYNLGMNHTYQLTKKQVYALFGGAEAVAKALGYTSAATAHNWPAVLTVAVSDRVRGAAVRLGLLKLESAPSEVPAPQPAPPAVRRGWCLRGGRSA